MLNAANKIVNFYELFNIELKRLGHIQIHWTKMHLETFPSEKGNRKWRHMVIIQSWSTHLRPHQRHCSWSSSRGG